MKNVLNYINEALRIKTGANIMTKGYKFTPHTKEEFQEYVIQQIQNTTDSQTLDLSYIDCKNLSDLRNAFYYTPGVHKLEFKIPRRFAKLDITGWNVHNIKNFSGAFGGLEYLEEIIGLDTWDMSNAEDITRMFSGCMKLKKLDLSKWKMPNLGKYPAQHKKDKIFNYMFLYCTSLEDLKGYENWDLSQFTGVEKCFSECRKLKHIDISNWNLGKSTNEPCIFNGVFKNCISLESVNVSNNVNKNYTSCSQAFLDCHNLTTIKGLDTWDVSNVTDMTRMFGKCKLVSDLSDIQNWDVRNVESSEGMFEDCESLQTVGDISGWKFTKNKYMSFMFKGCKQLVCNISSWVIDKQKTKTTSIFKDVTRKIFKIAKF